MSLDKCRMLKSTALAASVAALMVLGAGAAFSASSPPREPGAARAMMDPQRLEDRLNTLKTELKITDAQMPAWNGLAEAMRANANAMHTAAKDMRPAEGAAPDALRRLEAMDAMAKVRAEGMDRLLAAFRPLYAQMSDEQRQVAAQKLMPHRGHNRGHG